MHRKTVFIFVLGVLLLPVWTMAQTTSYDITKYGAVGDGKTNNATAINQAIAAAAQAGGGTVVVPPGDFVSGPLKILSNVTLHLEAGSMIRGSKKIEDYYVPEGETPPETGGNTQAKRHVKGLISMTDANNVAITGRGTIEGSGITFMDTSRLLDLKYAQTDFGAWIPSRVRQGEKFLDPNWGGPQDNAYVPGARPGKMIQINNCNNVLLSGVTVQNSPNWTIAIANSRNVDILGIKINSFGSDRRLPNDDGIDLTNCRFVHIDDCDIQNSDDSLALFGIEDFTVTNSTLSSHDSAIRVGYDAGEIRNGVFSNLVLQGTRGINVNVRGSGVIENLLFENLVIETTLHTGYWWGKGEPIHISALPQAGTASPGVIRDLRFSNIIAVGEAGMMVYGSKQSIIRNIEFNNVKLKVKPGSMTPYVGGNFDLRGDVPPELAIFKHDIPGMYCTEVDGLKLRNFELEWEPGLPDFFSHGIECENFKNLLVDGFEGRQALAGSKNSAISLANGSGVTIRNSVAVEGTQTFLTDAGVTGVTLINNDLSHAKVARSPVRASATK